MKIKKSVSEMKLKKQYLRAVSGALAASIMAAMILTSCGGTTPPASSSNPASSSTNTSQPSSSSSSSSSDASSKPDPNKVNWTYVQNGAKTVTLTGYDSTCKEPDRVLTLPSQIDGYTITEISSSAFSGTAISELSLPASVKTIGKSAFSGTGISYLILPEGLTEIESGTFGGCDSLRSVYIPASVKYIDSDAFSVGVVGDVFGVPLETDRHCHRK